MADYPAYNILMASTPEPESGIVDDFSQGGTMHSRTFHDQTYFRFDVQHDLTKAEFDAITALYDAGARDSFTNFKYYDVSPEETYTVQFLARPRIIRNRGNNTSLVSVSLRGTKD